MKAITLSIDQMKHLIELGIDLSKASFGWVTQDLGQYGTDQWISFADECNFSEDYVIPALSLDDILELLPPIIHNNECYVAHIGGCNCSYTHCNGSPYDLSVFKSITKDSNIEAAYGMLLWCIENDYI